MNAPTRQRLQVDERREQLLRLALELFSDRTYEELSIDEIARAAGVSKGLLYHYFPSKRAFYVAAVQKASEELLEATESHVERGELPDLHEMKVRMEAYLRYVEERAQQYRFLLRGGMGDEEVREIITETRSRFADRILEAFEGGHHRPKLRIAARGWVGFVEAASLDWVETGGLSRGEMVDWLISTFLGVLRTAGAID